MKIFIIYCTIGIVILHFVHGSETLKNVSNDKKTPAIFETELRQPRQANDIHTKRRIIKNVQPKINDQSTSRTGPRPLRTERFPLPNHYNHPHHQAMRLKPALRRRYQVNSIPPNQGYSKRIHKVYTQHPPNYPIKNYPIKKYFKSPNYHHKIAHYKPNFNRHQHHNNHQHYNGNNDLKSLYSQVPKSPSTFHSKGFHASPTFSGNVIVRPSGYQKHNKEQQLLHNELQQQQQHHEEEDSQHPTKSHQSSYAVYDDTSDDITQKPLQYHVQLKNPSLENGLPASNLKASEHNQDTVKYLNFMTSKDYFLPKSQPDYHIRTGSSNFHSDNTNIQHNIKDNYMNIKTNLDFSEHKYNPSNDFNTNTNNYHYKDWYDPEKFEFTENDAIHSSFTSSPQKDYDIGYLKTNYVHNNNQVTGTSAYNVASLTAAGNKNNNDKEKWSTPITYITKRKDTFLRKSMSDEQISKECSKKCFSETDGINSSRSYQPKVDATSGFNESEIDCYESCINTYTSQK